MAGNNLLDESSDTFQLLPATDGSRPSKLCRVLVIENDQADYDMIVGHLKTTGGIKFHSTRAELLKDALVCLAKGETHVVLLGLPDRLGLEFLRRVHAFAPEVPVVVIADVDDDSLATEAAGDGAQDYLVKRNLHTGLLVRSIRYAVSRTKNRARLARSVQLVRAAVANLRNIIASNVDGMIVVDDVGAIQFWNPAAGALVGSSLAGSGDDRVDWCPPQLSELCAGIDLDAATGEATETNILRIDGRAVPVEVRVVEMSWLGEPARLVMLHDLTQQKLAEEELRKHRSHLEKLVDLRTAELSKANEELQVLLKEIHHRVKNNMQVISSLLNTQSRRVADDRVREICDDMRSRVESMARVHEQLYRSGDMARVDFATHIKSLVAYLSRFYRDSSGAVVCHEDVGDVDMTLGTAVPCGLIVNELVSNAMKHAFPDGKKGEIRVGLRCADGRFTLSVADNGVGLPADVDCHATNTMGLQVVTTLVKQLKGTIECDRHGGTAFKIAFPESG